MRGAVKYLHKLSQTAFVKQFSLMFAGSAIAQLIGLCIVPVLSRIYTPAQFGEAAFYLSLSTVFAVLACGRFDHAIVLPADEQQALGLFRLCLSITVLVSACALLVCLLIFFLLPSASLILLWFFPLTIFLNGIYQAYYNLNNRKALYANIAQNRVWQAASAGTTNITGGFCGFGVSGLLGGYLIGVLTAVLFFAKKAGQIRIFSNASNTQLLIKEYRNFPLFSAPMGVLNALSVDLMIYLLNFIFGGLVTGLYSIATKAVNYPLSLISTSFTAVFFRSLNATQNRQRMYILSYLGSIALALVFFIPVYIWGRELFVFVLGKQWAEAATIAVITSPLTIASFAMRNVSFTFSVTKQNQLLLLWQIAYLVLGCLLIWFLRHHEMKFILLVFSIYGTIMYLVLAWQGWFILKHPKAHGENS